MNIYILERTGDVDWDEFSAKVIKAANEKRAREVANIDTGNEGELWTDEEAVTCNKITMPGNECEILGSYLGG